MNLLLDSDIVHQAVNIDQNFVTCGKAFDFAFLAPHTDCMYGNGGFGVLLTNYVIGFFDTP
jgi:hypothetical protein